MKDGKTIGEEEMNAENGLWGLNERENDAKFEDRNGNYGVCRFCIVDGEKWDADYFYCAFDMIFVLTDLVLNLLNIES